MQDPIGWHQIWQSCALARPIDRVALTAKSSSYGVQPFPCGSATGTSGAQNSVTVPDPILLPPPGGRSATSVQVRTIWKNL
ncbi:unnamed protein product [Protopolystoma xenopodis]|uniref:Uncharacterized protein n=1 Tax=Protopolystoma xenopodis TaxID=117903 RepID=A0A3S5AFI2_9PLAT|nr:unnamed protein product [Protopolystoma xenopodis]